MGKGGGRPKQMGKTQKNKMIGETMHGLKQAERTTSAAGKIIAQREKDKKERIALMKSKKRSLP